MLLDEMRHHDVRSALVRIAVPTLVLANQYDPVIGIEHAREVASLVPGGIGSCATPSAPETQVRAERFETALQMSNATIAPRIEKIRPLGWKNPSSSSQPKRT